MRKLTIVGLVGVMTLLGGVASNAADRALVFKFKGARLMQSHDVMVRGELTATDFTIGKFSGHAVFDSMVTAHFVSGHCRFTVSPGEDKYGIDSGWMVDAKDVSGGKCAGVANGHYVLK